MKRSRHGWWIPAFWLSWIFEAAAKFYSRRIYEDDEGNVTGKQLKNMQRFSNSVLLFGMMELFGSRKSLQILLHFRRVNIKVMRELTRQQRESQNKGA